MVKYVDNVWHAAKVAFGNEVGRLCKSLAIDSHEVMDIFVKDTKLNLSPYYLKPAFAFGGSCLRKEVRAVSHIAGARGIEVPLIDSLIPSNNAQIREALRLAQPSQGQAHRFPRSDLQVRHRRSAAGKPHPRRHGSAAGWMANGSPSSIPISISVPAPGAEIGYIAMAVPAQAAVMDMLETMTVKKLDDLMTNCDVVVVSHATDLFAKPLSRRPKGVEIIDLARLFKTPPQDPAYQGIAW